MMTCMHYFAARKYVRLNDSSQTFFFFAFVLAYSAYYDRRMELEGEYVMMINLMIDWHVIAKYNEGEELDKEKESFHILVMCNLHNSDTLNTRTVSPQIIMFTYSVLPPSTLPGRSGKEFKSTRTCGIEWPLKKSKPIGPTEQVKGMLKREINKDKREAIIEHHHLAPRWDERGKETT